MSIRRFLWALACICTSAAPCSAEAPAAELELRLAQAPALYLRLDLASEHLHVMVRGMELDRYPWERMRISVPRAPRAPRTDLAGVLPAVWRVAGDPQVEWRTVVAPPTLVPYDEESAAPTPVPKPADELPTRLTVALDNGWYLHLGPRPPASWGRRVAARMGSGWRRLWGGDPVVPPPTLAVEMDEEHVRALVHVVRDGTLLLVTCGSAGGEEAAETAR